MNFGGPLFGVIGRIGSGRLGAQAEGKIQATQLPCWSFHPGPMGNWHTFCTKTGQGVWMDQPSGHRACIPRCKLPVPTELDSVGLCVHHFTWSVEEACAEMHRQVALRQATVERRAEMATYISECALLLARVASNLCLSDDLKRRILCTFLSLMNLKENLERAPGGHAPELRVFAPGLFPTPAMMREWLNSESNDTVRCQV